MNNVMKIVMKILGEGAIEILPELFTISRIKGMIKEGNGGEAKGEVKTEGKGEDTPDIKFSGLFDFSDEMAYAKLLALLNRDPKTINVSAIVNRFINSRLNEAQRRRFRVVVGSLGKIDFVHTRTIYESKPISKKDEAKSDKADDKKGESKPDKLETKKEETCSNLGSEFLKSFAAEESDDDRMQVCQSIGILQGFTDKAIEALGRAFQEARAAGVQIQSGLAIMDNEVFSQDGSYRTDTTAGKAMAATDTKVNQIADFLKNFGKRP